jgi:hypothetical protein
MAAKGIGGALSLSPDGKLVVFGANDGCVYAVDTTTGRSTAPTPLATDPPRPQPPFRA